METQRLKVIYTGGEIDSELDREIQEFAASVGYPHFIGSGMDLTTGERDLSFDSEEQG